MASMTRRKLFGALALSACGIAGLAAYEWHARTAPAPDEPFGRLTVDEVDARLQEAKAGRLKLYVYDNNSQEHWQRVHLPGARWVQYNEIRASDLPPEKDATLVFYCANEY